jgi:hypothetical protein
MTMHLAHPALTLGGKKKGKKKFRNADEARKARELAEEWQRKQQEWASMSPQFGKGRARPATVKVKSPVVTPTPVIDPARSTRHIPSVVTPGHHSTAKVTKVYTGTKMLGIGTMHKSNSVPIFSDEEAVAIATMRRN